MIRFLAPLGIASCIACAPASDDKTTLQDNAYATQLTAPSPDYAAMDFTPPAAEPYEAQREASGPLPEDAKDVGERWAKRLSDAGHIGGMALAGPEPDSPIIMFDTLLTAGEFDQWLETQPEPFPDHITLYFQPPLPVPSVSEAARKRIRFWPAAERRTGMQHMAALGGRVVVRDGCFFYIGRDKSYDDELDTLAWFLMETGLDVDEDGYLVLVDRYMGQIQARVGEVMRWAGPNGVVITDEQKAALFDACGEYPIESVGNPRAEEKTYVEYPHTRPQAVD